MNIEQRLKLALGEQLFQIIGLVTQTEDQQQRLVAIDEQLTAIKAKFEVADAKLAAIAKTEGLAAVEAAAG